MNEDRIKTIFTTGLAAVVFIVLAVIIVAAGVRLVVWMWP